MEKPSDKDRLNELVDQFTSESQTTLELEELIEMDSLIEKLTEKESNQ